ncbi:hypothetical protein, partial [Microbulbifer harenosus]|uniref:hypothetical protein n=1 Tax=Microbulbifer harenosus TaxID=2576840 RepID=UPI001C700BF0
DALPYALFARSLRSHFRAKSAQGKSPLLAALTSGHMRKIIALLFGFFGTLVIGAVAIYLVNTGSDLCADPDSCDSGYFYRVEIQKECTCQYLGQQSPVFKEGVVACSSLFLEKNLRASLPKCVQ